MFNDEIYQMMGKAVGVDYMLKLQGFKASTGKSRQRIMTERE